MDNNKLIIVALLVIIIALLVGIMMTMPNFTKTDESVEVANNTTVNETASDSATPDTIRVELPGFDTKYSKTVGEYRVEAEKWRGASAGGFGVWLYKNDELVYKDSYLSRAYFYMDGEWKWSDWGNGQGANYHKYPVGNGVEIQEVEVKF